MAADDTSNVSQQPFVLSDEPLNPTLTAVSTLSLLTLRLSRLESALNGISQSQAQNAEARTAGDVTSNIPSQLRNLETCLTNVKRLDGISGSLVRMIDSLHREYPEIFSNSINGVTPQDADNITSTRDLSSRATQVLSHAPLYTSTSSRLQTLQTLRIPSASLSANLINTGPRLEELKRRQEKLDLEIQELKSRSSKVVQWWVETGVVGMDEVFNDWEGRVEDATRSIHREERRQAEERGDIG